MEALEPHVHALRCAINDASSLVAAERASLRRLLAALDQALHDARDAWREREQDVLDNQTSQFLRDQRLFEEDVDQRRRTDPMLG